MQRLTKFKNKAYLACLKADWLNTVAAWLNGMKIIGGEVIHTPDGIIINPFILQNMSGGGIPAYFDILSTESGTITIRGGVVRQQGRGLVVVPDTEITPSGSSGSPNYVALKVTATGTLEAEIVCLSSYPQDDGTFVFRALWEAYVDENDVARVGLKCDELAIRSPI